MKVNLCVVFAVTSLPRTIMVIVNHLYKVTTGSRCIVIRGWLYHILFILTDIKHCVNFFLYCLT